MSNLTLIRSLPSPSSPVEAVEPVEAVDTQPLHSEDNAQAKGFGKDSKRSERDSTIARRNRMFERHLPLLKREFILGDNIPGVEVIEYEGHVPSLDLSRPLTLITGWLGAGKTHAVLEAIIPIAEKKPVAMFAPRNTLCRNTESRAEQESTRQLAHGKISRPVDIRHYQDDVSLHKQLLKNLQPGIFAMCPESLRDHLDENLKWQGTTLILDEFKGIAPEALKKPLILKNLERALTEAPQVLAVDAFLSDKDIAILKRYRPQDFANGNVRLYRQKFEKSTKRIRWIEGLTKDGTVSLKHDGIYLNILDLWLADEEVENFCIASVSKKTAKGLQRYLKAKGREVLLVCADTPGSSADFMRTPDKTWQENSWDVFCFSPTAQSGLDVQTPFNRGLMINPGIISPIQSLQMIGRARQCDEWWVSAPRMGYDPDSPAPMSPSKLKDYTYKLKKSWDEATQPYSNAAVAWSLYQSHIEEVERAFNSECTRYLLEHFFENVTVEFVANNRTAEFQELLREVTRNDAIAELNADLARGRKLLETQKNPATDDDVWNKRLAEWVEKMPSIEGLADSYREAANRDTEEGQILADELAARYLHLTSNRGDRILNYELTEDEQLCEQYLTQTEESLKYSEITYDAPQLIRYRYIKLYTDLNLKQLAQYTGGKLVKHETGFYFKSEIILKLWEEFKWGRWGDLFPMVETLSGFWRTVKRCMAFLGYQKRSEKIREQTPGEFHPNGKHRDGRQRMSDSCPFWFCGWCPMEQSGSKEFQALYPTVLKSCWRERLETELGWFQERLDKKRDRVLPQDVLAQGLVSPPLPDISPPEPSLPFTSATSFEIGQHVKDLISGFSGVIARFEKDKFLIDGEYVHAWRTASEIKVAA